MESPRGFMGMHQNEQIVCQREAGVKAGCGTDFSVPGGRMRGWDVVNSTALAVEWRECRAAAEWGAVFGLLHAAQACTTRWLRLE
jgi:hypothetical protein